MAQVSKSLLKKSLTATELVDPQGLTPYVAVHLGEHGVCHVRRTSAIGYLETQGAPAASDPGWAYVGYAHIQECLKYIEGEEVRLSLASNGRVVMTSVDATFDTELHIHTVNRDHSAFRNHVPGEALTEVDPAWLRGLNVKNLPLTLPPVILGASIVLPTPYGVVAWETTYDPKVPSSPRASFLRAVSAHPDGVPITLTQRGYYRAVLEGGLEIYTGGHQSQNLPAPLLGPPHPGGISLPANRTVQSLRFACGVAGPSASIHVSAKLGVTTRDDHGLPARFSLGDTPVFPTVVLSSKAAKLLVDSLEQDLAEEVTLQWLAGHTDKARMTRGGCSVSFPILPTE